MNKGMLIIGLIVMALFGLTAINLITSQQTGAELDYYLLKDTTEAAMNDAIDYDFYSREGLVRMDKEKFAESFVIGLCEDNNIDYVNFEDVKFVCEVIGIGNISSQSIKNITQIIYTYMETVSGASGIMPLSWLIGIIFEVGDEEDKTLLEETLIKPNAFGYPRKSDVFEVIENLKKSSANRVVAETSQKEEYIPKCPTCQSTDIKKVSTMSKASSVALWGLFSQKVKKQWHCNNCGSEW